MKKTASKKTTNTDADAKKALLIGAGVAALTAAGIYFFGPEGKKHQKQLKGWMIRMKGDIISRMENAKDMSEEAYHKIIDTVTAQYKKHGKIAEEDVHILANELKKQWKGIAASSVSKNGRGGKASSSRTSTKKGGKTTTA